MGLTCYEKLCTCGKILTIKGTCNLLESMSYQIESNMQWTTNPSYNWNYQKNGYIPFELLYEAIPWFLLLSLESKHQKYDASNGSHPKLETKTQEKREERGGDVRLSFMYVCSPKITRH